MGYQYHREMANKGRKLEELIIWMLRHYEAQGYANIQKISTPWKVIRQEGRIVNAFPERKSTLDFRGTVKGGIPVSFDAKESEDSRGLPLKHIKAHQIDYMRGAMALGEISFLVVWVKPLNAYFVACCEDVIRRWDHWKANKGKMGFNLIPIENMQRIPGNMDFLRIALCGRTIKTEVSAALLEGQEDDNG